MTSVTAQFSLCWDNFHKTMSSGMHALLESEDLVDVTLAVDGKLLKAHKMVLSVCSPYFRNLFKSNPCKHPIVFMKDVDYSAMCNLLQFMYQGEVQVNQENFTTFIKTAEALQIKGLTSDGTEVETETIETTTTEEEPQKTAVKNVQPVTRSKRQSGPASKRPKLTVETAEKDKPENLIEDVEEIQFKMEPYERAKKNTIVVEESTEEAFEEERTDDLQEEDTEEYSLVENEEPQPGTSTDGVEGQDVKLESGVFKWKQDMPRYIVDGFVFHVNIMKGNPPMTYLRCLEYKRLGCHARAVIPSDGTIQDIKVNKQHNHPPDYAAEQKIVFLRELKEVMLQNPTVPPRVLYTTLSEVYPIAARETPYELIRHKMNRWRRLVLNMSANNATTSNASSSNNISSIKCEL